MSYLNDRKQLLLERIGKLNDAIQLKQNHQYVYHNGLSAGKATTHIDDTERNGTYNRRKWTEVVSGTPKQYPSDRTPAIVYKSPRNQVHVPHKPPHNLHHQERKPTKLHDTGTIPAIVNS
jgi:hypothetical protein